MLSKANSLRLTLRFTTKPRLELRATEFQPPKSFEAIQVLKCSEGKAGEGQFEWRAGPQALCLCLIKFLCFPKEQLSKGVKFVFEGNNESPAKTIDNVIAKANKANCWQLNMFGDLADGGCRLRRYIKSRNAGRRDKARNYELEIQHEELPQESIIIEIDGRETAGAAALEKLADAIEDQWFEINSSYESEWAKVKDTRKSRGNVQESIPDKLARINEEEPPSVVMAIKASIIPSQESPSSPQAAKTLAEVFRSQSVASIKSHIIAALLPARGSDAVDRSLSELLFPECVNVVAEKLTSESVDSFCDFYYGDYDSPPNIKKSVAAVIASNPDLRKTLAFKVANCRFLEMVSWFHAFSFFCAREIVLDVEQALIAAAEGPGFKEKFVIYAPDRLTSLMDHFSHYGCISAIHIFEKINQEGRENQIKLEKLLG